MVTIAFGCPLGQSSVQCMIQLSLESISVVRHIYKNLDFTLTWRLRSCELRHVSLRVDCLLSGHRKEDISSSMCLGDHIRIVTVLRELRTIYSGSCDNVFAF